MVAFDVVLYGLIIHLRVTLGKRRTKVAWIVLFLLLTVIITYWGVDIVVENTRHVFGATSSI